MRLIDADALLNEIDRIYKDHYINSCYQFIHDFFRAMFRRILKAPTIDPASLRPKGEWITMTYWKNRRGHHVQYVVKKCSLCNFRVKAKWNDNFCPNCGADMRGERDG